MSKTAKNQRPSPGSGGFVDLVRQRARDFWAKTPAQRAEARAARGAANRKAGRHGAAALFDGVKRGRMHRCATTLDP